MENNELQHGEPTREELLARIAELEKRGSGKRQGFEVTDKGTAGLYGIRRFPLAFYKDEWTRILEAATGLDWDSLTGLIDNMPLAVFFEEHRGELTTKSTSDRSFQNTVESGRTQINAVVKATYDAIKAKDPKLSVAEAEELAYRKLGLPNPNRK